MLHRVATPLFESFQRVSLTWRFAIAALVVVVVVGYALTRLTSTVIADNAQREGELDTRDEVSRHITSRLTRADLETPMSGDRLESFDQYVRNDILSDRVARVKVWNRNGALIYSDDRAEIGGSFPDDEERDEALGGKTVSAIQKPSKAENESEARFGQLLEVYTPIKLGGSDDVVGAFEIYEFYAPVAAQVAETQRYIQLGLMGGLAFLYLVLLGIVEGGTRTINRQNRELQRARETLEARVEQRTSEVEAARSKLQQLYERVAVQERARRLLLDRVVSAQEQERQRIALELHDGPIQVLAMLGIRLSSCKALLDRGEVQASAEILRQAEERLNAETQGLRQLMSELRPPVLDERGLAAAIRDYCEAFQRDTGIAVDLNAQPISRLDASCETVLYRIVQEALTNVRRHSRASQVTVRIGETSDGVGVEVGDNGVGFEVTDGTVLAREGHFGILGMQQRAELSGGTWGIESAPGKGTTIRVRLPKDMAEAA
jgi:signal transduction histidine kinase